MTQQRAHPEQFTLHVSVATRWWLYHLPHGREATRFLHEKLEQRLTTLLAVQDIELQVFQDIASELGADLDVFLAARISDDVLRLFDDLQQAQVLELVPTRTLLRPALLTTALHHLPFPDALAVTLAEDSASPLLVADEATYQALKALESSRTNLRVAWLPEQLDP